MNELQLLRAKGRFKRLELLQEAMNICSKYHHGEYINDFKEIEEGLLHDHSVDYKEYEDEETIQK